MDSDHRGHGVVLSDRDRDLICAALEDGTEEETDLVDYLRGAW